MSRRNSQPSEMRRRRRTRRSVQVQTNYSAAHLMKMRHCSLENCVIAKAHPAFRAAICVVSSFAQSNDILSLWHPDISIVKTLVPTGTSFVLQPKRVSVLPGQGRPFEEKWSKRLTFSVASPMADGLLQKKAKSSRLLGPAARNIRYSVLALRALGSHPWKRPAGLRERTGCRR